MNKFSGNKVYFYKIGLIIEEFGGFFGFFSIVLFFDFKVVLEEEKVELF